MFKPTETRATRCTGTEVRERSRIKQFVSVLIRWGLLAMFTGAVPFLLGCASSPQAYDPEDVNSLETDQERYVVFYKSTQTDSLKNVSLHMDNQGNVTEEKPTDQATGGGSATDETDVENGTETPGEDPETDSTPGFDEFEDAYDSSESQSAREAYDPLEGYNRFMFQVNDTLYVYALKPVASGWQTISPEPLRQALDRGFVNLSFPIRFVNSVLQAEFEGAGREIGRFSVNSTVGLAGLFDPARHWIGWKPNHEDFGQTLGRWGVGPGFPLTLPIVGPSNLRDAGGRIPDGYLNPISYIQPFGLQLGVRAFSRVNFASLNVIGVYDRQKKEALDPYTFFRSMYRQNRQSEIQQ